MVQRKEMSVGTVLRASTRLTGGPTRWNRRTYAAIALRVGDGVMTAKRKNHRQRYCSFTFLYARPIRLSRCGLDFWRTKEEHLASPVSTEQRYAPSFAAE
jgi:hypothetical protein